jgi:hypothetical protein
MTGTGAGDVAEFDETAVVEAALSTVEGTLYSVVGFDADGWRELHVASETRAMYEDEAHMRAHFDRLHDYVNLDFTELELFTDTLVPAAEEVRYLVTCLDVMKLVRYYYGEQGLFLAVEPDEPVVPLVDALSAALDRD